MACLHDAGSGACVAYWLGGVRGLASGASGGVSGSPVASAGGGIGASLLVPGSVPSLGGGVVVSLGGAVSGGGAVSAGAASGSIVSGAGVASSAGLLQPASASNASSGRASRRPVDPRIFIRRLSFGAVTTGAVDPEGD